jgi:hypothetical protein
VVAGTAAGAALVVLRARARAREEAPRGGLVGEARDGAERALRDLKGETRKLLAWRPPG